MTLTSWPRFSAAFTSRWVEYRCGLRDRMAIFMSSRLRLLLRLAWFPAHQEGRCRIHPEASGQRRAAEQHAEQHRVAGGQRHLDVPLHLADAHGRADERPGLPMAT